uniref:Uncharacterized protein n=1 Tax=Triticum urartu TaxID=4572 RepID=A0A8R7P708_TRIUA
MLPNAPAKEKEERRPRVSDISQIVDRGYCRWLEPHRGPEINQ